MSRDWVVDAKRGMVAEPARDLPIVGDADVLVVGGGVAGLAAAVSAARNGARTVLIERANVIGGSATSGRMCAFWAPYDSLSGFSKEVAERLVAEGAGIPGGAVFPFDPTALEALSLDLLREAGVAVRLYTWAVRAIVAGGRTLGVAIESKSGREALLGRVLIDATGDGDLAVSAGAGYIKGRSRDGKMRPLTLLFRIGNIDSGRLLHYVREHPAEFAPDPDIHIVDAERGLYRFSGFFGLVGAARERREIDPNIHYLRLENFDPKRGMALVNTIRIYERDGTKGEDLTDAEVRSRRIQRDLLRFMRGRVPGLESVVVMDTASSIGVRETRHILGEYLLTEEDVTTNRSFSDTILIAQGKKAAGQPVHTPDAGEGSETDVQERGILWTLYTYQVPYACLIPRGVEDVLLTGRCISATHEADGFTRDQPTCMGTGQAAGAAAARACQGKVGVREIDVQHLRALLGAQGLRVR